MIATIFSFDAFYEGFQGLSKKKNVAGLDAQSVTDFATNLEDNLRKLAMELREGLYQPIPVKIIDEDRKISLVSIRDKLVQQLLNNYLSEIILERAIPNNFGYMRGRSIFQAVDTIYGYIEQKKPAGFSQCDIQTFFASIDHDRLKKKLQKLLSDSSLLTLTTCFIENSYLNLDGKLIKNTKGLILGSPISPVLSNVYLLETDERLSKELVFYVRFSDDMLCLDASENHEVALEKVSKSLEEEGLVLNTNKTRYVDLKTGFRYLGHNFKMNSLKLNMDMSMNMKKGVEEIQASGLVMLIREGKFEVLLGELRHFRQVRDVEMKTALSEALKREDKTKYLILLAVITELSDCELSVDEESLLEKMLLPVGLEEVQNIAALFSDQMETLLQMLVGYLIDCGHYEIAMAMNIQQDETEGDQNLPKQEEQNRYLSLFKGCPDAYARGYLDVHGKRQYYRVNMEFTSVELDKMLQDRFSSGIYPLNEDHCTRFVVLDIDMDKKFLLQVGEDSAAFTAGLERTREFALSIKAQLKTLGIKSYVAFSGYKGYHVWMFFNRLIQVEEYKECIKVFLNRQTVPPGISVEIIPSMSFEEQEVIKLPLAYHEITRKQAVFISDEGFPDSNQMQFIAGIQTNDPSVLKHLCQVESDISLGRLPQESLHQDIEATKQKSEYKKISDFPIHVVEVYEKCALMRYFADKSFKEHFLGHFERNALLYVFGHIEEGGREFLHFVISRCVNYSFEVTEGFIARIREKPVSCQKLKMRFEGVCQNLSCDCCFDEYPVFYPAPVIFAYMLEPQKVTRPDLVDAGARITSMLKVQDTLRINTLVAKVMELAKQRREIEKEIRFCQEELEQVFVAKGVNEVDVPSGTLVKNGKEWYLKLDI